MKPGKVWALLGMVIGAVAAGFLLARSLRRRGAAQEFLPWRIFERGLAAKLGQERAGDVVLRAKNIYTGLVQRSEPPENLHLRVHLYQRILPGLALYRALAELHGGNKPAAYEALEGPFRAWAQSSYSRMMQVLSILPAAPALFRLGFGMRMEEFPEEGWKITWRERSNARIAFDMGTCYYLKTLTALKAPELTSRFCQMDDWMGELLPPGIRFVRSSTLARGGPCCDFQYTFEEGG